MRREHDAGTPFFVWFNATHMHFRTHVKPESTGRSGRWQSEYHDTMLDQDDLVGELLAVLDRDLTALRFDHWKLVFLEQRARGTLNISAEPYVTLRVPKIFNLRTHPYECADITSNTYCDWILDHAWLMVPAQAYVAQMLQTLAEFPPRQKPASFSLEQGMAKLQAGVQARERW